MDSDTTLKGCGLLLLGLLLFAGIGSCVTGIGIPATYSDGERIGVVTKISHKGIVWKTWEAQMNLGGMKDGGKAGMVPNIWEFSVTDAAVIDALQRASETQQPVRVKYHQPYMLPISEGDTNYLAVACQPVSP